MSAGLRYKFQGSIFQVLIGFDDDSPPAHAITGISKANPAVVTSSAHGLAEGDVVRIVDVVGMTEVNTGVFIVTNPTTNTFELTDVNSTGYGTWTSGGSIQEGTLSTFCELTSYNRSGGTSPLIPATTVCSIAQEFEIGLPDFGTTQLSYNFAPLTSNVQEALHAFYLSSAITAVKVTLPNSGGVMLLLGFVQQESETSAVSGLWTGSTTIKNTGNRVDIAA